MPTKPHEEFPCPSLRYRWPEIFKQRRMFDRSAENEPYLEFLRTPKFDGEDCDVSGDEDDDSFSSEPEDDEDMGNSRVDSKSEGDNKNDDKDATVCSGQSIARLFMAGMMGDEEVLQYPDQVEQVASFYEKGSLGDDAETKASQNENVVALLDDRNICGTIHVNRGSCQCTGHCRPYLGPLTSEQLGKALEKKRFRLESDQKLGTSVESDAERRSIFIAGLNPSTIDALIRTAPRSQAPALRDLLYKHLTSKTSIGVTIPSHGFCVFTLDFHIPYYALRVSQELLIDPREKPEGKPLRVSRKLPFLPRPPNTSTCPDRVFCLYEAQISVVVTGIDHWVWTAYGFVDTYFELKNPVVAFHQQLRVLSGPGRADPLAAGRIDANKPIWTIWTPREYFFKVFEIRMDQVLREWNGIFLWAEKEVKQSRTYLEFPLPSNNPKVRREFCAWNSEMVNILRDFISRLSDTVWAWNEFLRNQIGYFQDDEPLATLSSPKSPVAAVDKTISTLRVLLLKLEGLEKKLCKDNPQGLNAHLIIENHEATIHQQRTGRHIQVLTVVTVLFLPLALDASLFSAKGVLPLTPNFAHFTYVLLFITVLVAATLVFLFKWHSWLPPMITFADCLRYVMIYYERRRGKEQTRNDATPLPRARRWSSLFLGRIGEAEVHELGDLEMQREMQGHVELD